MLKLSAAPSGVKFDPLDEEEREHDGNEPECVRDSLEEPADEIGPTVRAAYQRMCDGSPVDCEFPEVRRFGKWARGRKGKPFCLAVISLVFALQRHHDADRRRERKLAAGEHAVFPISGEWVARMLEKYGVRPDMTELTRIKKAYEVRAALQDVGILRLEVLHSGTDNRAAEFTVWTCSELDANPAAAVTFTPAPDADVSAVVAEIEADARAATTDEEGQLKHELGAIRERVKMAGSTSARRFFEQRFRETRRALFFLHRERHKAEDAAHCTSVKAGREPPKPAQKSEPQKSPERPLIVAG